MALQDFPTHVSGNCICGQDENYNVFGVAGLSQCPLLTTDVQMGIHRISLCKGTMAISLKIGIILQVL